MLRRRPSRAGPARVFQVKQNFRELRSARSMAANVPIPGERASRRHRMGSLISPAGIQSRLARTPQGEVRGALTISLATAGSRQELYSNRFQDFRRWRPILNTQLIFLTGSTTS